MIIFVNYTTHSCVYFLVNFLVMGIHGVVSPSLFFFCVKFGKIVKDVFLCEKDEK